MGGLKPDAQTGVVNRAQSCGGVFESPCEYLKRRSEGVRCTRAVVKAIRSGVELFLRIGAQIGSLGQVLPDQSVGVLASAALPRAVQIAKVDVHAGLFGQIGMTSHFAPLVIGQTLEHGGRRWN